MIFHIVKRSEWTEALARGSYAPASLRDEGFIHCSTAAQVVDTANRFYRGHRGLVVLCIEEERLGVELKYEAPVMPRNLTPDPFPSGKGNQTGGGAAGDLFPHLYGELNVDAVVRVVELVCEADGSFRLVEGLLG